MNIRKIRLILGTVILITAINKSTFPKRINKEITAVDIETAILKMRDIKPDKLSEEEKKKKSEELDEACNIILKAKYKGVERIIGEFISLEEKSIRDDYFYLEACRLLSYIDAENTAATVNKALKNVDLKINPEIVYDICHSMACTHKPVALPVLRYFLKAAFEGTCYFSALMIHSFSIDWPQILNFTYGTYGPGSSAELLEILKTSKNDMELAGSIYMLTKFRYLPALPIIRDMTMVGADKVRCEAIKNLGKFACPGDQNILKKLVKDKSPEIRSSAGWHQPFRLQTLSHSFYCEGL